MTSCLVKAQASGKHPAVPWPGIGMVKLGSLNEHGRATVAPNLHGVLDR